MQCVISMKGEINILCNHNVCSVEYAFYNVYLYKSAITEMQSPLYNILGQSIGSYNKRENALSSIILVHTGLKGHYSVVYSLHNSTILLVTRHPTFRRIVRST